MVGLNDEENYINNTLKRKYNLKNNDKVLNAKLDKIDCSMYQTILHSLLFFAKYTDIKRVQEYIYNSIMPPDVLAFDNYPAKTLGATALKFVENDDIEE